MKVNSALMGFGNRSLSAGWVFREVEVGGRRKRLEIGGFREKEGKVVSVGR
jgi:hypothetical protein